MEEKVVNKMVAGAVNNNMQRGTEKLSYEQLENVAHQLSNQNNQLRERLQNVANVYQRLNYLFMVLQNASHLDEEFVKNCSKEIENIMTIPEEVIEEESEEAASKN